jgi:hypothetical protein
MQGRASVRPCQQRLKADPLLLCATLVYTDALFLILLARMI